jgi:hypothetical protein
MLELKKEWRVGKSPLNGITTGIKFFPPYCHTYGIRHPRMEYGLTRMDRKPGEQPIVHNLISHVNKAKDNYRISYQVLPPLTPGGWLIR